MPSRTYKLIDLVGISDRGFDDAAKNAIKRAQSTLQGLAWFEVVEQRGALRDGRIEYQVKVQVAFKLMDDSELAGSGAGAKKKR
jgi:dodecin